MENISWLEFKHNVLNGLFPYPEAQFVTLAKTTVKKRTVKRYSRMKGYGKN